MLHYAWAWGQLLDLIARARVAGAQTVNRYYIILVVLEPKFYTEILPYQIHPETMHAWVQSQRVAWKDMAGEDALVREPYMVANHWDNYGECEYRKGCFEHHWDPQLMTQDYVNTREEKVR